jgi:hypothetical protein
MPNRMGFSQHSTASQWLGLRYALQFILVDWSFTGVAAWCGKGKQ